MRKHWLLLGSCLWVCCSAQAGEQIVVPKPSIAVTGVAEYIQVAVNYSTANPENPTLTGIGVRLHWNSSHLSFQTLKNVLASELIAQGDPEFDTTDFDSDSSTDTFVHLAWSDIDANWPNLGSAPVSLFTGEFITEVGVVGDTTLNVSVSSTAAGYTPQVGTTTVAGDCVGPHIEITAWTLVSGKTLTCTSTGDMVVGTQVIQETSSSLLLYAATGIRFEGPISIATGATFAANHGAPQP